MIFRFIKLIPAFYRLFREWGMKPQDISYSLVQYQTVIYQLTNGRLSKLGYKASDIVQEVTDFFCEDCDLKGGEQ